MLNLERMVPEVRQSHQAIENIKEEIIGHIQQLQQLQRAVDAEIDGLEGVAKTRAINMLRLTRAKELEDLNGI